MKAITPKVLLKDLRELIEARRGRDRSIHAGAALLAGWQAHPAGHLKGETGRVRGADSADTVGGIDEGVRYGIHGAESRQHGSVHRSLP